MEINRSDIYKLLRAQLKGDYSIGLHGISSFGPSLYDDGEASDEDIYRASEEIMQEGLVIFNNRTINGTVAFFGRIDDEDNVQHLTEDGLLNYNYGGRGIIIVAIPTTFKSRSGESMYLGDTQINGEYKRYLESQGYQISTLRDAALSEKVIPLKYILGAYMLLPDGNVDFQLNQKHMSFGDNRISDDEFDKIKEEIKIYLTIGIGWPLRDIIDANLIYNYEKISNDERIELYNNLRDILLNKQVSPLIKESIAAFLETLKQYINEPKMRKLEDKEDIDVDILFSELHRKCEINEISSEVKKSEQSELFERESRLRQVEDEGRILDQQIQELDGNNQAIYK